MGAAADFSALTENWDGYGAAAPDPQAIELAREFVALIEAVLKKRALDPATLYVSPTRTGGVLVEWEDRNVQHEVQIDPDRSFSFLHVDKATGQTKNRKSSPDTGFLHELCQFLAA